MFGSAGGFDSNLARNAEEYDAEEESDSEIMNHAALLT